MFFVFFIVLDHHEIRHHFLLIIRLTRSFLRPLWQHHPAPGTGPHAAGRWAVRTRPFSLLAGRAWCFAAVFGLFFLRPIHTDAVLGARLRPPLCRQCFEESLRAAWAPNELDEGRGQEETLLRVFFRLQTTQKSVQVENRPRLQMFDERWQQIVHLSRTML